MGSRRILFAIVLMLFAFISSLPAAAATQTFPNTTRINIPGSDTGSPSGAPAAPYPSTINVTDLTGVITDVDVRLFEFNHTFPADVDILLVGPHGQNVILMSDVGGPSNAHDATLTFDQSAGAMGATVVTGTFSPTNNPEDEEFPSPAPPPPYGASLDVFNGTDPNGEWNLYVIDDFSNDTGYINGGWELIITTTEAPTITSPATAAGVVGSPFSHTFTATGNPAPTLSYNNSTFPPEIILVGDTLSGTPLTPGVYTIDVTASNGVAPDATQTFNLTVTGDAPLITSADTAAGVAGSPFSHTFTAIGNPAPTLSYSNENLPPGVTRTGDTLAGTPLAAGTYTIDVTASNGVDPDAVQTFTITVTETVAPPPAPPPPPVPTCDEVGNESNAVIRAQAANSTVFCRVLVENGSFKGDPGQVGNLTLIQWGIVQAVDVFGLTAGGHPIVPFAQPVYVCLKGTGTLYYADASNAPRTYSEIASVEQDGFTCASISNAGTLVLVRGGA